jgi:hypothetical protein
MAKLTANERKAIPSGEFGMPKERKYPMPDKSHAANAKSRASQQEKAGRISKSTEEKIDRKADRVLHHNVKNSGGHADKLEHG